MAPYERTRRHELKTSKPRGSAPIQVTAEHAASLAIFASSAAGRKNRAACKVSPSVWLVGRVAAPMVSGKLVRSRGFGPLCRRRWKAPRTQPLDPNFRKSYTQKAEFVGKCQLQGVLGNLVRISRDTTKQNRAFRCDLS